DYGAIAAYRAGEIYEEHLGQREAAEKAFTRALGLRPHDRPATDALARVRTQLKQWNELAQELEKTAQAANEPAVAGSMLVRAAQTWTERIHDDVRAISCYERALSLLPQELTIHRSLEVLYRK